LPFAHARDPADDDRVAFGELRDALGRAPVAICARQIGEQVVCENDADFGKFTRQFGPDAR